MSKIDEDFENNLIDFDEWFYKKQIENGYLFCQECTDNTNGNWDVWVNPEKGLCEHLKNKESEE